MESRGVTVCFCPQCASFFFADPLSGREVASVSKRAIREALGRLLRSSPGGICVDAELLRVGVVRLEEMGARGDPRVRLCYVCTVCGSESEEYDYFDDLIAGLADMIREEKLIRQQEEEGGWHNVIKRLES